MEALYTTRAMRRVKPDPIPLEVQRQILDAAIRAPSGANTQQWRFLLVDDSATRARLGQLYRDTQSELWAREYTDVIADANDPRNPDGPAMRRLFSSAQWLADHFDEVPLLLFAFGRQDATGGGSIYPATWSAQLAARAHGVGSALTTLFQDGPHSGEVLEILDVPADDGWRLKCMLSFGYPLGRWGVAARQPVHEVAYRNRWGNDVGFEVPAPLWPPPS